VRISGKGNSEREMGDEEEDRGTRVAVCRLSRSQWKKEGGREET
jgi:hypothetical protein